jgi:hypothetical protein
MSWRAQLGNVWQQVFNLLLVVLGQVGNLPPLGCGIVRGYLWMLSRHSKIRAGRIMPRERSWSSPSLRLCRIDPSDKVRRDSPLKDSCTSPAFLFTGNRAGF